LRDVQIAARHADPRTTMRYDRARKNLDRHPNYILAAPVTPADQGHLLAGSGPTGDLIDGVSQDPQRRDC
jgi:hypothetical protein